MANVVYNSFKSAIFSGLIDLENDAIYCMLVSGSYVPDQDTHTHRSDVTNEVVGTAYTAGGAALSNKAVTVNHTTNKSIFDADDVTWSNSTITARAAVLYVTGGGGASTDRLISYNDFGSDKTSSNGNFTVTWDSNGILDLGDA